MACEMCPKVLGILARVRAQPGVAGPRGFEPRISGFHHSSGGLHTVSSEQFGALIRAGLRALHSTRSVLTQINIVMLYFDKFLAYPPSLHLPRLSPWIVFNYGFSKLPLGALHDLSESV